MSHDSAGYAAQDQGRIGENELRRLADEGGLIPIRAEPDLTGWDFCVEEREPSSPRPFDCRPSSLKCQVQVKTVSQHESRSDITLVNWERMAKDLRPWFVLVVRVVDRKPVASFLVHIGKYWIERTLERLTKEAARGRRNLSKKKMPIKWSDEDRIDPPDGAKFSEMLRHHSGEDPSVYAATKQSIVETAGFDGAPYRGSLRIKFDDLDHLAEFAVGERSELPVEAVTVDRVRFGIPVRLMDEGRGALTLQSSPYSGRARASITRENTGARCTLEFDIAVASAVFDALPYERDRVVLHHPVLKIVMRNSTFRADMKYKLPGGLDTPVPLRDIGPASEFVAILAEATRPVRLDVSREGQAPIAVELPSTAKHLSELGSTAIPIANAWAIARRLGIEDTAIVPRVVLRQRERLFAARAALEMWPGISALVRLADGSEYHGGAAGAAASTAVVLGETVCALGLSYSGAGDLASDETGRRVITIRKGVARAHGARTMSGPEFEANKAQLQQDLHETVIADLTAAGIVNLYIPPSEPGRLPERK